VETTSSGYMGGLPTGPGPATTRVSGQGVFMDVLFDELERRGVASATEEIDRREGSGGRILQVHEIGGLLAGMPSLFKSAEFKARL
jgi:hypothetical protein